MQTGPGLARLGAPGILVYCVANALVSSVLAQAPVPNFADMTLAELSEVKVTSASREERSLAETAASLFVITQEDIRRSGLNSIPELLRMVPGLDVARLDANEWAISARGFNERFADKMQVLIDGRSLLTPLASFVYWNVQDLMLEDIERIEVIRGPGATLWGANAVNGVINIITRKARDTQGVLVTAGTSKEEGGAGAVRYGGQLGDKGFYRLFVKDTNTQAFTNGSNETAADSSRLVHGGMRAELELSKRDELTLWADMYGGRDGTTVEGIISLTPPLMGKFDDHTGMLGGNLQASWKHQSSERFDTTLLTYFSSSDLDQTGVLDYKLKTVNFDLVQHLAAGSRHDLIWGANYRLDVDQTTGSVNISFNPANRSMNLFGVFLQDQIALVPNRVWLTLGAKLEHNSFSGFALQPNVRILWAIRPKRTFWAAASHVAENSSRTDADIRYNSGVFAGPTGMTTLVSNFGTHVLPADKAVVYEIGYREDIGKRLSLDTSIYYNYYWNRHSHELTTPYLAGDPSSPYVVLPTVVRSDISGETYGLELSATAKVSSRWKVTAGYTFFQIHLHTAADSVDSTTVAETEGGSPHNEFVARSMFNVSHRVQFDTALYFVGKLDGQQIPQYTRIDARLGWQISRSVELSVGAQNLLDPRHFEFGSGDLVSATQMGRNVFARLTWRY